MRRRLQKSGWDWAEALSPGNLKSTDSHCPEWRAQATIDFIEKNKAKPFFCYIAENLMHMPPPADDMKGDPRRACGGVTLEKAPDVMPSRQSVFDRVKAAGLDERESAALLWLDDMVGAVLKKLEDEGLRDNTMVVFLQDNGHHWEGKNTVYEGGLHVSPTYISWPAGQKNPGRECSELVSSLDCIPTFLAAAGSEAPGDCVLDGVSLLGILKGTSRKVDRESLYAEMGHTRAVITKKWKYIAFRVPPSREHTAEEMRIYNEFKKKDSTGLVEKMGPGVSHMTVGAPGTVPGAWQTHRDSYFDADQLYNLQSDPQELRNLASNPEYANVLADMKKKLRNYCLNLPGTFGEIKTAKDCPREFIELLERAKKEPLIRVSDSLRVPSKFPKVFK